MKRIYLASDHAGTLLKDQICEQLAKTGYEVKDLGANGSESVDYPDFAASLAEAMLQDEGAKGILVCGSGIGISIAANRFPHSRRPGNRCDRRVYPGIMMQMCWPLVNA